MTIIYHDLDVRPILKNGGEPFGAIMQAVAMLDPGEGLRLLATFKPTPLFPVMEAKGFASEASEIGGGDWQVLFRPTGEAAEEPVLAGPDSGAGEWPEPARALELGDLDPPEPMVRILAAAEEMQRGEVLSALLSREPMFLFPELAKRGHAWRGAFEADGTTYRIFVRIGAAKAGAA
ncbi:MAG: DUF2249 domain-containing protein [Bauldia sp.]|nr:MAG: DUF2249 domain-containing protein [Bauldia sp.]